jgi:cytochrome P450
MERLAGDLALLPNAIEEMLRYNAPVHVTSRTARETALYADQEIPAHALVFVALAGANRDPEVFEDPDTFDIVRANADQHLSFANGIHHCLGARLARLEASVAFTALLTRCRDLRLSGPVVRRKTAVLQGITALPIAFESA